MYEQPPASSPEPANYDDIILEGNAQRSPVVLCLDTSYSMGGAPIAALNDALREWTHELRGDPGLSQSVEIAVITFGGRQVQAWQGPSPLSTSSGASPFVPAEVFEPPVLFASGVTLMTEALELAMHLVASRKRELRELGLMYYRPQICLLTDGQPTDATGHPTETWRKIVPVLAEGQDDRHFLLFAVGVGGISAYGEQVLKTLSPRFNVRLDGFPFRDLLQMMSASLHSAQRGEGDEVHEKMLKRMRTQRPASGS